ncbi:uncharacterized protein EI90DRAFT_3050798 [Cantharellus anzutake]|uniref:uncharacterized protein n=1 Tax=Cantharellus anzutake TaxID=1750568 RepID=UPI001908F5E8|nr:uncharacterized protein EI90DRAFT_3050798 [Cantharellus anzutake]KAF8334043.1 hypothetical protein EI90DRAFT_3050798 [Cantharellus anzutake]
MGPVIMLLRKAQGTGDIVPTNNVALWPAHSQTGVHDDRGDGDEIPELLQSQVACTLWEFGTFLNLIPDIPCENTNPSIGTFCADLQYWSTSLTQYRGDVSIHAHPLTSMFMGAKNSHPVIHAANPSIVTPAGTFDGNDTYSQIAWCHQMLTRTTRRIKMWKAEVCIMHLDIGTDVTQWIGQHSVGTFKSLVDAR